MTPPVAEFRKFLGGLSHRYSDEQMASVLLRTQPTGAQHYAREETPLALGPPAAELPSAQPTEQPSSASPEDVKDLEEAKVEHAAAETLAKAFPADKNVTRADFEYRESPDITGKDRKVPKCGNCFFYAAEEVLPDRLGTCGLFQSLVKINAKRFQLAEDVGHHMVCDAWSGELNDKHGGIAAQSLATHYADFWNHLRDLGDEPTVEESEHVDDELDGSGWGINYSDGRWNVIEYPDQFYDHNEPRSVVGGVTVEGKTFRPGTWLPLDPSAATPEEKAKIQETKAEEIKRLMARKQKLAAMPVDREALQQQVDQGGDVSLSDVEQRSVDYGYRALKRHHGSEVLQRLAQLISGLSARMEKQPGDEHLKRKMAAYGYMLGRANADFPPEIKGAS